MTTKNQTRRIIQRLRYVFPFVLVIVGLLALAGGVTKVFQQNANPSPSTTASTPLPHSTYTSDNLGISFTYATMISGVQHFFTKEIGDKVYLYYNFNKGSFNQPFPGSDADFLTSIAPGAFFVEVFNKDPQQSLAGAIKQHFLTGYSESNCFVNAARYGHPRQDESFQTAIIDFPHHSNQTRNQLEATAAKCPGYVNSFNGVSYFMMDPKHPNKLLFIRLGQGNIPSGVGPTWDGTIKVY